MDVRRRRARAGRLLAVLGLALLLAGLTGVGSGLAAGDTVCYVVADGGGGDGTGQDGTAEDLLVRVDPADADPATNETTIGTGTGTFDIEASAFRPGTGVLFAVDLDELGTIDLATGLFTGIGAAGSGTGADGAQDFDNLDGLTFDPDGGVLYATQRRRGGEPDLLISIDPATGAHVPDAFGAGVDYVEIDPIGGLTNIDDIAVDPADGTMYAIANEGGAGDHLVVVDPATGDTSDVGATGAEDIEGLSFTPGGTLIGTTGKEGPTGEALWDIDTATGAASNERVLDNASDYESVSCIRASGTEPTPTVSPTTTVRPSVSPSVRGRTFIPETGPEAVVPLAFLGLALFVAGAFMVTCSTVVAAGRPGRD